jgi:Proliferating cell nuclear antigen, N-terminal domain
MKAEDTCDAVSFMFEAPNQERIADFELKLMDIDAEQLGIPDTDYAAKWVYQHISRGQELMAQSPSAALHASVLRSAAGCCREAQICCMCMPAVGISPPAGEYGQSGGCLRTGDVHRRRLPCAAWLHCSRVGIELVCVPPLPQRAHAGGRVQAHRERAVVHRRHRGHRRDQGRHQVLHLGGHRLRQRDVPPEHQRRQAGGRQQPSFSRMWSRTAACMKFLLRRVHRLPLPSHNSVMLCSGAHQVLICCVC